MSTDSILRQLAKLAREQHLEEAPRDPAEARREQDLIASPGSALEDRLVEGILSGLPGASRVAGPVPVARSRRWWWVSFAGPVALAAAGWLLWARGEKVNLPQYAMTTSGGIADRRSPGQGSPLAPTLVSGEVLEVLLRPATAAEGPVEARLFWVRGGQGRAWNAVAEVAPGGAIRIRGPVDAPFGPGDGELVVIVGRPGKLPDRWDGRAPSGPENRVLRQPVLWR